MLVTSRISVWANGLSCKYLYVSPEFFERSAGDETFAPFVKEASRIPLPSIVSHKRMSRQQRCFDLPEFGKFTEEEKRRKTNTMSRHPLFLWIS